MSEVSGSESTRLSAAVLNAAAAGQKIEAIKILRAEQGLGLREAKEIIDDLQIPSRGSAPRMGAEEDPGGFRLLVACVIVGSALAAFYLL